MPLLRLFILVSLLVVGSNIRAHDPGLSSVNIVCFPDRIEVTTTFSGSDAQWLQPQAGSANLATTPDSSTSASPAWFAPSWWQLRLGQSELIPRSTSATEVSDNNVVVTQLYPRRMSGDLRFTSQVFDALPPGHRQYASIVDHGQVIKNQLLQQSDATIAVTLLSSGSSDVRPDDSARPSVSFADFFHLGIQHIITGYDHLLFLCSFLLAARSIRTVFKIVTSFTVAHSLTLAFSALEVVSLPALWVEPLIAATIVVVAFQNLLNREQTTDRVGLTFAFGLIHGFGFASVLREMGVSELGTSAWRALAGFNIGVELGQIAVASLVFPLLWFLRSRPSYERSWSPAASTVIALAGGYWLVERLGWI